LLDSGDLQCFVDAVVPFVRTYDAYCGTIEARRGHREDGSFDKHCDFSCSLRYRRWSGRELPVSKTPLGRPAPFRRCRGNPDQGFQPTPQYAGDRGRERLHNSTMDRPIRNIRLSRLVEKVIFVHPQIGIVMRGIWRSAQICWPSEVSVSNSETGAPKLSTI
jgi:hypothetical protein